MVNFFRFFFSEKGSAYSINRSAEGSYFGPLDDTVRLASGGMYVIIIYVAVFAAITSFVAYAIMMILASGGRERDESKRRIERGALSAALIFCTLSLVMIIYKAFI